MNDLRYEELKDSYPRLYLHDLIYDGTAYTWRWYEDGELVERRYRCLLRMEDPPDGPGAAWDHAIRYVLVNDPNVTWEDIWRGMISSQSGAYIDHAVVYQEYVYADDALAKALERLAVADESIEFSYTQAGNTVSLIKPLNRLAYPGLMREHAQTLLRNYRYEFEDPAEFLRSGAHNALTLSGQGLQLEFWEGTDYVRLTEGDALRFYRADRINELLRQYAGITLDDLRTDWRSDPRTPYLSEYDAFYNFTSDFGPGTFYPAYGYRNGEQITLLEAGYFGDMLILAERPDGGFWFVEHSPSGRVPQGF